MSLRLRLTLLFGSLLVVLLAAAGWWSNWLTQRLRGEIDATAVSVGRSVVSAVGEDPVWFGEGDSSESGIDIVVERVLKSEGRTVRAVHHQHDGRIIYLSVQVGDAPAQVVELPVNLTADSLPVMHEFKVHAVREAAASGSRLRLESAGQTRDIPIPAQGVEAVIERFSSQLIVGLTGLLGLGLALAAWIAHRVSDPLRRLQVAADQVGRGELGVQVDGQGVSEVNAAVNAFNTMSRQLVQLEEARVALRENRHLSEIGEIGRGLAHSLRNPLNAIGLAVEELASRTGDSADSQRLAEDVRRQIRRIDQSIRNFLTLADRQQAEPAPVDLREVIQDVVLEVTQQLGHGVELKTDLPDGPVRIDGLEAELRAMIQALVVNAVEASDQGQVVEVRLAEEDGQARIEVLDRGEGVPKALRDRLFQPHATSKPDGSGMGLYLSRRLAENRYAGTLALSDRAGAGTRAQLRLGPRMEGEGS